MILTSTQQWVDLYDTIKAETRKSTEKHVNIYVSAADADSVCALRVLEALLQNDLVPYGWTAVSRYQEVIDDFTATYEEADEVTRFVVLINCGASEDLYDLLGLGQRPQVCVVVIDSHRPVMHLANDNDPGGQIFVLLDEAEGTSREDIPVAIASDDEDGSGGDSEQENEDSNRQRQGAGSPGTSGANGDAPVEDSPRARRAARRRELERQEALRRQYYSQGVHFGKPSACVLFDLAYHLQQDSSYLLWLALLGLTDQLVHARVGPHKYEEYYLKYEDHVAAGGHLDPQGGYEAIEGEGATTSGAAAVSCRIAPQQDFRFGLLREWSLWLAMANSPYVASRLQTYTEKGRQRLEFLLAKLGIPLREARGSFQFDMKPRYRERLQEQLALHGAAYNLGDAIFRSFQLQDGFTRCVMAVDVVHAATALLESGAVRRGQGWARDGEAAGGAGAADARGDHRDRFWRCWNALSWRDDEGELRRGIELAKKVQAALVADGGSVVVQRLFHNFKAFRIFDLSEHKLQAHALLCHPMALQRLAAFFQDQYLHQSHASRRKPVVLIGPRDGHSGRCLVVGYQVTAPGQGNTLGAAFEAAAESVGAQAWHDLFDTAIMEVAADDVDRFKGELLSKAAEIL